MTDAAHIAAARDPKPLNQTGVGVDDLSFVGVFAGMLLDRASAAVNLGGAGERPHKKEVDNRSPSAMSLFSPNHLGLYGTSERGA